MDANCDNGSAFNASPPPVSVVNSSPVSPALTLTTFVACPEYEDGTSVKLIKADAPPPAEPASHNLVVEL